MIRWAISRVLQHFHPVGPLRSSPSLPMTLLKRIFIVIGLAIALRAGRAVWLVVRAPATPPPASLVVNDISQINPIHVEQVITPRTTEEIIEAVRAHPGPVSIGGARH